MLYSRYFPAKAYIRLGAAAALLILEVFALTVFVDTGYLRVNDGLAGFAARSGSDGLKMLLLASAMTWIFAVRAGSPGWLEEFGAALRWRVSFRALLAHAVALAVFSSACLRLFRADTTEPYADWLAAAGVLGGAATFLSGFAAFVPGAFWKGLWRRARWAPAAGLALAVAVVALNEEARWIAKPWLRLTFAASAALIHLVKPAVLVLADRSTIVGRSFDVTISWQCSGYEGVLMMLFFGSAWLAVFRREFRFPRALLLVPAGVIGIWIVNCVRIAAIFLIGDAGATQVAAGGFHSQAGWIAFVGLAATFSIVAQRLPWFAAHRVAAAPHAPATAAADPTAAFLAPFLAIMTASLVGQAASAGFEWAYPLRVLAAAAVLWRFRREYAALNWSVGVGGALIGLATFAIWVGAEPLFTSGSVEVGAPAAFAAAPAAVRWSWLLFRIAGAVITVPIAEELAFRGYALRRLASPDFASVDLRRFAWMPFLVSSVVFGAMHGRRWIVGALAGMLFAWAARRRGSIGDAVLAHAVANVLLAAFVLATGDWRFW
jgi:exosortase E/protease (VPEID-CTERM system)